MRTQNYRTLLASWPASGRHILAQFDASTIQVYQAYRPAIAQYAVEHQQFGGEFSFERMSWIKPNFLWMITTPTGVRSHVAQSSSGCEAGL